MLFRSYDMNITKIFSSVHCYPEGIPEELKNDRSLREALDMIARESILGGEFKLDLHNENIMEREDGTVVITDPYA